MGADSAKPVTRLRRPVDWIVTITPKFAAYSGSWSTGEHAVTVTARDRNEAIRRARAGYEDGKVNPATFRARKKRAGEEVSCSRSG